MQKSTAVQGINLSKIVFLLSLITFVYWLLGNSIAIYKYAVVGALIEILWLPMILLLFLLPLFCFFFWMKEKWSLKSLFLYSFLIGIATVVLLVLYNS
jgi:hypothetical protein